MTFTTESGSTYEVNMTNSIICRTGGTHPPTKSQGTDGEWKSYNKLDVFVGKRAFIQWEPDSPKFTVTTPVKEIHE